MANLFFYLKCCLFFCVIDLTVLVLFFCVLFVCLVLTVKQEFDVIVVCAKYAFRKQVLFQRVILHFSHVMVPCLYLLCSMSNFIMVLQ